MIRDGWFQARRTTRFTLQWHLTNACPFHCRHCYDRSTRGELDQAEALRVLEDLADFGRRRRIRPALSLSGGDPLCYPHFWTLYQRAAELGWPVSILGNPVSEVVIERLFAGPRPSYYQVSLEGLRDHNDFIRGAGHYDRVMTFLGEARRLGLPTHVMLTLTRENLDQVIPLGRELRGWTERFTFNRLALVGEGASLSLPEPSDFATFLQCYLEECRVNPVLGLKDNLFNVVLARRGRAPFSGCTGHGCGAAFNFVALLPDGEVHACRKFPSLLGNIRTQGLDEIYSSVLAARFRSGPQACRTCSLKRSCRGCPAVTFGCGLDPHTARDPFCFHKQAEGATIREVQMTYDRTSSPR